MRGDILRRTLLQWGGVPAAGLAVGLPHAALAALREASGAVSGNSTVRPLEYAQAGASASAARGAEAAADMPLIDSAFGAVGDGATDDTAAILAAFRSGKPFRFGPKTYVYKGNYRIDAPLVQAAGVPGLTRLVRRGATPSQAYAGLLISAATVMLDGIVFDAGGAFPGNPWNVVITGPVTRTEITRCRFTNSRGDLGIGLGLFGSVQVQPQSHIIDNCEFDNCDRNGLMLSKLAVVEVTRCRMHDIKVNGLSVESFDKSDFQAGRPYAGNVRTERLVIAENHVWNCGQVGISLNPGAPARDKDPHHPGGWPLYGPPSHPMTFRIVVRDNMAWDCGSYGLVIAGDFVEVTGNISGRINGCPADLSASGSAVGMFGCMSGYMRWSRVAGNIGVGYDANGARSVPWGFDIGAGGNWGMIEDNVLVGINGSALNVGGGESLTVRGNICYDSQTGIHVDRLESDGSPGGTFSVLARGYLLEGNRVFFSRGQAGILMSNNPEGAIRRNDFVSLDGADPMRAVLVGGPAIEVSENSWNTSRRWPAVMNGANELIVPDGADEIVLDLPAGTRIAGILTATASVFGSGVSGIVMTGEGSGYTVEETTMTAVDSSGRGKGAVLQPWIWNGGIIGARVSAGGTGYNPATTTLVIKGDGHGAGGTVTVGLPVPRAKSLRLIFTQPAVFKGTPVAKYGVLNLTEVQGGWTIASRA